MVGRSAQVARGLNTIAARISTNTELLGTYGIQVEDTNGNLKSTYDVLRELKPTWDNLSEAERVALGNELAGINQYKVLASVMQNFQTAIDATTTAYESAGSAAKENAKAMESLESRTNVVLGLFQQLSTQVVDSELVKVLLDVAKVFLQIASTPIGSFVIQVGLLGTLLWGTTGLINAMKIIPVLLSNAAVGAGGLGLAISASAPQLFLIAAAIAAVVTIAGKLKTAYDEANPSLEEANEQLKTNKDRLAEINAMPWTERSEEILKERDALEEQNRELQDKINKLKEIDKLEEEENGIELSTGDVSYGLSGDGASTYLISRQTVSREEIARRVGGIENIDELDGRLKELGLSLDTVYEKATYTGDELESKLIKNVEELIPKIKDGTIATDDYAQIVYNETVPALQSLIESYKEQGINVSNLQYALDGLTAITTLSTNGVTASKTAVNALTSEYPNLRGAIVDTNGILGVNFTKLNDVTLAEGQTKQEMYELIAAETIFKNSSLNTSQKVTELIKLATAAGVAADSLSLAKLAETDPRAGQAIVAKYGSLENYFKSKIGDMTSVETLAPDTTPPPPPTTAKQATDEALSTFQSDLKDLEHERELATARGEAFDEEYYARLQGLVDTYTKNATANMQAYGLDSKTIAQNMYQHIEELAKHASEVETRRLEALKQAAQSAVDSLTEQQQDYETAFSYVIDQIDKEIEALERQKDAITESYQTQIDALNEANEAIEDQIALEEALEALYKAQATKVMVYKDGRYQYIQDVDAVSSAKANLEEQQRAAKLKEDTQALEGARDAQLRAIDDMIYGVGGTESNPQGGLYSYKLAWQDTVEGYEDEQGKLLAAQLFDIDTEQKNWTLRLSNLSEFVAQYEALMAKLKDAQNYLTELEEEPGINPATGGPWHEGINEGVNVSGGNRDTGAVGSLGFDPNTDYSVAIKNASSAAEKAQLEAERQNKIDAIYGGVDPKKHATGTINAPGGLSLVGENGPELRLLNQGDGILPADITKNLWAWGSMNPATMLSSFTGGYNKDGRGTMQFDIANISLPGVSNANQFVEELKGFRRYAFQYGTGV